MQFPVDLYKKYQNLYKLHLTNIKLDKENPQNLHKLTSFTYIPSIYIKALVAALIF